MRARGIFAPAARRGLPLLSLTLLLAGTGCGKDLVAGGARDTEAVATDSRDAQPGTMGARGNVLSAAAPATGTLTFAARVALVDADGRPVPLNTTPATATVGIAARDTARIVARAVPVQQYATARVVFTSVEANVTGGLAIGGITVTGRVAVAIADSVVVERPVTLPPGDGGVRVVVDLRSSEWLAAADPITRVVPTAAFRSAVRVSAVGRP